MTETWKDATNVEWDAIMVTGKCPGCAGSPMGPKRNPGTRGSQEDNCISEEKDPILKKNGDMILVKVTMANWLIDRHATPKWVASEVRIRVDPGTEMHKLAVAHLESIGSAVPSGNLVAVYRPAEHT